MQLVKGLFISLIVFSFASIEAKLKKADYVIVGIGTAGAVMAKELSDKYSVIGLHEGANLTNDPLIEFTAGALITVPSGLFAPVPFLYDGGNMVPQIYGANQTPVWVEALPLGGASSINAGAYCKGTTQGYSQWEGIAGPIWSPNNVFAAFKALEDYRGETTNPASRGYKGPIDVRQEPHPSVMSQKLTDAIIEATGFPFVLDYNDPTTPIGASSQMQYTQNGPDGIYRVSSATAFLNKKVMKPDGKGVKGRKLQIYFNSTALRTIWKGNKAVGVEYLDENGKKRKVYAKEGVIVCAGLKSSTFLMHSGIGPKALLNALDIPVVFDNPNVGQNLGDQPHVFCLFETNPADATLFEAGIFENIAWLPDPNGDQNIRALRFAGINPFPGILLVTFDLVQEKSRGSISINSADPLASPVVDDGLLSDSSDLDLYIAGFQTYIKNISIALSAIDPQYQLVIPDPAILDNTALLTDFIKKEVDANQHYQCHCKMAPLDQGGVVDSTGHVHGVEHFIIADNSINPTVQDGSPQQTAYLVAYKIARLLLGLCDYPVPDCRK